MALLTGVARGIGWSIVDHVRWNSEAGRISGVIIKKIVSDTGAGQPGALEAGAPRSSVALRSVRLSLPGKTTASG